MRVDAYNFFFHPLHEDHSVEESVISIITTVVLSILTGGLYLLILGAVHLKERCSVIEPDQEGMIPPSMGKIALAQSHHLGDLKEKMSDHLVKLQRLAARGEWSHLQTHTSHQDSGFDWWMFPTNRPSRGQGTRYMVSEIDIALLKEDREFMETYRKGVILVAKSWGFDLENQMDLTSDVQKWTGYQVRLGKMLHSLQLFGERELFDRLVQFIDLKNIRRTLEEWIISIINS